MINPESAAAVHAARFDGGFVRPIYDTYGFAQIPHTVRRLFGLADRGGVPFGPRNDLYDQHYDAVVLLLIDGFGWRFFQQYADGHPFLRRFMDEGVVNKLTSQFPSTTSAHITTIHTGMPPGKSGVFEWFFYDPEIDAVVAPLLFSLAGDKSRNTLQGRVDPGSFFPRGGLYHELAGAGVASHVMNDIGYARSPFSEAVTAGAQTLPFRTLPETMVNLGALLGQDAQRRYVYLYADMVDGTSHHYGPDSPQTEAEILVLLDALERVLHRALLASGKRVLLLVTADHGHIATNPKTTIALNTTLPSLLPLLRTNRSGQVLTPGGSSRDPFLYVQQGMIDEAEGLLREHLAGRAVVRRVRDMAQEGFFGPEPGERFLSRAGDLVVLPNADETVWWYEKGRFEYRFYGSHGGLSPEEMETILLALPYG